MIASFAAYVAMYDGKLYLFESLAFIIMYIVYLIILIGGHFVNRQIKERRALRQAAITAAASKNYGSIPAESTDDNSNEAINDISDDSYPQLDISLALTLRHAFLPRDDEPWSEKSRINKIFSVLKVSENERFIVNEFQGFTGFCFHRCQ